MTHCYWLKNGDNNTKFFHSFSSGRVARNSVISLTHDSGLITREQDIQKAFFQHMQSTLGEATATLRLKPKSLYPEEIDLTQLGLPFLEEEVAKAVCQLAKNKASGPDGIPNKFLQEYWPIIKKDIMAIVNLFYNHDLDLSDSNRANIIMIPKKEVACVVQDFRPISVINVIPKLLSKLLASRLSLRLKALVYIHQTTFIRGRYITEKIITTREILSHIKSTKNPTIFVKIDFLKAFDSVNWIFLEDIMIQMGFPIRWVKWVKDLLHSGTHPVWWLTVSLQISSNMGKD